MSVIPQDHLERLVGWGGAVESVGYVFRPTTPDGIKEVFRLAKETGRKVTLRGAGRARASGARRCR